ncbi:purine permease 21-like [Salvia miltiorrhiza]|uniref:purine permease 21-like n=1 Tax=Salvia miltiorrhiza TaxID=226208 RepID=UPI0025AD4053|nr:purine permease 21-like [Salvia miltiorrhiza]
MDPPIQETISNSTNNANPNRSKTLQYRKWSETAVYSVLVLSGQSAAALLGRLYYEKGGKSKYMAALVQTAGFPLLLPFIILIKSRDKQTDYSNSTTSDHSLALPALYACFGTFLAFICMLYSIGLMYLPLSTFSLICATQLGFNALFSHLINAQRLSPPLLNSVFLLTLSSVLLALRPGGAPAAAAGGRYAAGFACTLGGAAGYALLQSLEQRAYGKLLRRQRMKEILDVIFYESMAASFALALGLFGSGEWRGLKGEIEGFGTAAAYAAVVVGAAAAWQVFAVGMVALILKVSSVFGNVVSGVGEGLVPVLAVVVFKDGMSGVKVVAFLLAVWGSVSYVYHQFVIDKENGNVDPPMGD